MAEQKYIINRSTLVKIADSVRNLTGIVGNIEVSDISALLDTVKPASAEARISVSKVTKIITINQPTDKRITVTKQEG